MAQPNGVGTVQRHELEEVRTRLEWIDEERRKAGKRVAELEQTVARQGRDISARDQRIADLETRLANATLSLNRVSEFDPKLHQLKDELVELIEQYDARRVQTAEEASRLRRVEQEMQVREIADIRKELPAIQRLQTEMELRQAEESRLSQLIGKLQMRMPPLENRVENWERDLSFVSDKDRQWTKSLTDLEAEVMNMRRQIEPFNGRMDLIANNVLKVEGKQQGLSGFQEEVRRTVKEWVDQIQLGEYERNQRVDNWNQQIEAYKGELERFTKEWVTFSEQYKEAQMAVDAIAEWQRQFEQQQRESSEISRVEIGRMQSRWDNFLAEYEKRWRNFETDQEQRTSGFQRRDTQMDEQMHELRETLRQLEAEKDTLWRVQTAQLDAIKNFPRVWVEEVEKARARDPHRRRQPALVPVDNEQF